MYALFKTLYPFFFFIASFAKESTSHGIEAGWHDGTAFGHLRFVMILIMIYVFSEFPVLPSMYIERKCLVTVHCLREEEKTNIILL